MSDHRIKICRRAASAICFILFMMLFSGLCLRLFPFAKSSFYPAVISGGIMGLLWLAAALLWGRVFCSWCCPLGFVQDIAGWLGKKLRKKPSDVQPPRKVLRHSVGIFLFLSIILIGDFTGIAGFIEPFSLTGKIMNGILRPALQYTGNTTSWWSYSEITPVHGMIVGISAVIFIAITAAAFFRERLFCNTICPAGWLLGVFSSRAFFRLRFNEKCIGCGACVRVCKAGCIDLEKKSIDSARCVVCGNCSAVCPKDALEGVKSTSAAPAAPDPERRKVLIGAGAAALAAGAGAVMKKSVIKTPEKIPPMPPGAGSFEKFTSRCTGCQLCIANCPGKVLTPAVLEYGISSMGQPRISIAQGFCDYDCKRCSDVCPAGALSPMSIDLKRRCRIGLVTYYRNRCVVVTDNISCGACAEHCPTGALNMVKYKDDLTIPELTATLCIGCGGCEYICPVRPERAVIVSGSKVQVLADDPAKFRKKESKTAPDKSAADDAFPF